MGKTAGKVAIQDAIFVALAFESQFDSFSAAVEFDFDTVLILSNRRTDFGNRIRGCAVDFEHAVAGAQAKFVGD